MENTKSMLSRKQFLGSLLLAACWVPGASAQSAAAGALSLDRYTAAELAQRAVRLKQQADQSGTGSASEVLAKYPGHFTVLGFRDKSGEAELHTSAEDIDVVLNGTATLITGGSMAGAKTTGPGELRGPSIEGGQKVVLKKGDILRIPANTPHQMLIPEGASLTYFVIKVETPAAAHP